MEDKKRREKNVMISGMPESSGASPEIRKHEDIDNIRACLLNLSLTQSSADVTIDHCFRIGNIDPNRPRLLKVVLGSVDAKLEICKKARELRNVEPTCLYRNCYINPDRTKAEHEAHLAIRKQRKARDAKKASSAGALSTTTVNSAPAGASATQTLSGESGGGPPRAGL